MYRRTLAALAVGVTLASATTVFGQMPVTKVVVAEAREVDAPATIMVVGTVEPARRSRVCSEVAGLVDQMPGREGDRVEAGAVICRLDTDTLRLRLAEEQAKLAGEEAKLAELVAGTRKEELRRLEALHAEAEARHQRWKFEMERVEKLYAGRDSNDKEYYDTRAELLAAERRKIAAEAAYNLGLEGPRKETIAQAEHAVTEQKAAVLRIETGLKKTVVRAPFTGYIVERIAEVGEWIGEGGAVAVVIDLASVLVLVDAPESALPYLVVGDAVHVKVDALQRVFEGRIKHIMRQADPRARTFPIKIEVENPQTMLAAGMFARATLPAGPKQNSVAVPKDAIVQKKGVDYVAMVFPGRRGEMSGVLLPVTLGVDVDDWMTITSGNVRPGAQVITRGTERILPFPTPVEIVDERGTPVAMPDRDKTESRKEGA